MRLRPVWPVLPVLLVLLVPTAARANDHTASIFGAFSVASGSTLKGLHGALEVSFPTAKPLHDYFGIIVDASGYGGSHNGDHVTRASFLVGGRGMYRIPNTDQVVSGQLLIGIVRTQTGAVKDNNFASAIGGGYEYLFGNPTSTAPQGWGVRFQSDYVFQNTGDGFARVSIGAIYRFR